MSGETVGSYNMSWASDSSDDMAKLKTSASEYSFLLKNKGAQRAFWENAKTHLQTFITEKKPIAVGLQEMNVTADGAPTGTGAIKAILQEGYTIVSKTVESKFGSIAPEAIRGKKNADVGISIIIDTTRTGPIIKEQVLDNDRQTGFVDGGRPLLMVLTEKGYLFVNIHGAQNPGLGKDKSKFNEYMVTNNKEVLQAKVGEFIAGQPVQTIYVMGDFNDRYDGITEFTIDGKNVKYDGESPRSCCHNWDSSSVEARRVALGDGYFYGDVPKTPEGLYVNNFVDGKFDIKSEIPDEDVKIKNYLYKGDKVFSNKPGKLFMFKSDLESVSSKSDHELVFFEEDAVAPAATVVPPATGAPTTTVVPPATGSPTTTVVPPATGAPGTTGQRYALRTREGDNKPAWRGGKRKSQKQRKQKTQKQGKQRKSRKQRK